MTSTPTPPPSTAGAFLRPGRRIPRARRRWRWRTITAGALVGGLLAWVGAGRVRHDPAPGFALEEAQIDGVRDVHRAAIDDIVARRLGTDLLAIDLATLRWEIERLSFVESVFLAKRLPHGLLVKVSERPPVALVLREERLHSLSPDGRLIGPLVAEDGAVDLPIVVAGEGEALAALAHRLDDLTRRHPELVARIAEIRADGDRWIVHDSVAECDLVVGLDELGESLERWSSLWPDLARRFGKIGRADLRFRNRIVLEPVEEERA